LLTDVEDKAVEIVMGVLEGVVELMQVDGVYGDVQLSRADRILAFEAAMRSGELDSLVVVNPALAKRMAEQFVRDTSAMPALAGG
jgi:hypothetical protein